MPGIRLGALVIPRILCDTFSKQKQLIDINTSSIPQGALDYFIRTGMYDQHIRKVRACYKRKLLKSNAILNHVKLEGVSFHVPKQGIFVWITLPFEISATRINENLLQNSIMVSTSSDFYLNPEIANDIRLCISGVAEENLIAFNTMIEIIRNEMK